MDREYLQDYEERERTEIEKVCTRIIEEEFSFQKDKYPPDERFVKLQKPVAFCSTSTAIKARFWAQVPFSGSVVILLSPLPRPLFERSFFEISEIPKIVDFIKETGRLQVTLSDYPLSYEGLDYLDLIFKELEPPVYSTVPLEFFGNEKEIKKAMSTFDTLARVRFLDYFHKLSAGQQIRWRPIVRTFLSKAKKYAILKLSRYAIVEDLENLIIDDPPKALDLLNLCKDFIIDPMIDLRSSLTNYALEAFKDSFALPLVYQPQEIQFRYEIGEFLLKKLTYAPIGLRACNELIDHYKAYDLRKMQESLNEAIVTSNLDILNKGAEELSEILDNVWNDKTIPRKVKGLQIGIPLSIAAIGSVAAGPIGAIGGFLAGLGFEVLSKSIEIGAEGLSEKIAKLRTKSYQANIYDFKKKYKGKIRTD